MYINGMVVYVCKSIVYINGMFENQLYIFKWYVCISNVYIIIIFVYQMYILIINGMFVY